MGRGVSSKHFKSGRRMNRRRHARKLAAEYGRRWKREPEDRDESYGRQRDRMAARREGKLEALDTSRLVVPDYSAAIREIERATEAAAQRLGVTLEEA